MTATPSLAPGAGLCRDSLRSCARAPCPSNAAQIFFAGKRASLTPALVSPALAPPGTPSLLLAPLAEHQYPPAAPLPAPLSPAHPVPATLWQLLSATALEDVFQLACRRRHWDRLRPPQSRPPPWRWARLSAAVPRGCVAGPSRRRGDGGQQLGWHSHGLELSTVSSVCWGPLSHGHTVVLCSGKLRQPLVLQPSSRGGGTPAVFGAVPAVAAVPCVAGDAGGCWERCGATWQRPSLLHIPGAPGWGSLPLARCQPWGARLWGTVWGWHPGITTGWHGWCSSLTPIACPGEQGAPAPWLSRLQRWVWPCRTPIPLYGCPQPRAVPQPLAPPASLSRRWPQRGRGRIPDSPAGMCRGGARPPATFPLLQLFKAGCQHGPAAAGPWSGWR